MSYLRFGKHYIHTAYLALGAVEFVLLCLTPYAQQSLALYLGGEALPLHPLQAVLFALVLSCGTLSMGVYMSLLQDGFLAMFFRTLVAFCFVSVLALTLLYWLIPAADTEGTLVGRVVVAIVLVLLSRWFFRRVVDSEQMKRRVVIFGAGEFAQGILDNLQTDPMAMGITVVGCVPDNGNPVVASERLLSVPKHWYAFCRGLGVSEIIIAPEERRNQQGELHADLMECKLRGIDVTAALDFLERTTKKAQLELVHPSWILYSEGFKASRSRDVAKRLVDLSISLVLLVVMLPFIALTALAVYLESGGPVLYSQERVGMLGKTFRIYKFRSMRQDAEKEGKAVWAAQNDSRVTRVGAFIRNTRLDELPQIYNVIVGEMSIVGPRPERPEFVAQLKQKIPFYDTRHYVKPGLMGWAQLNYPYGASVDDARGKLEYDLYYSKNHSFLIDLLIMIQTVEVVLLGKGVR